MVRSRVGEGAEGMLVEGLVALASLAGNTVVTAAVDGLIG